MKKVLIVFGVLLTLLSGCDKSGGGNGLLGGGSNPEEGKKDPEKTSAYKVTLTSNRKAISSGGSDPAIINIAILDKNNAWITADQAEKQKLIKSVVVSDGGVLKAGNSYLSRQLETFGTPTTRNLKVTVELDDGAKGEVDIKISGFTVDVNTPAPSSAVQNQDLNIPLTVKDSLGNNSPNQDVVAKVGNREVSQAKTGSNGVATLLVPGSEFSTVGQEVSVTVGLQGDNTQDKTLKLSVLAPSTARAEFTEPSADGEYIKLGATKQFTLVWPTTISNRVRVWTTKPGATINSSSGPQDISVSGGSLNIDVSSTQLGSTSVNAQALDNNGRPTGAIVSRVVEFIPSTPDKIVITPAPDKIFVSGVGISGDQSTTEITVIVTGGVNNVAVPGETVLFSNTGTGSFVPSSGTVTTGRDGKAKIRYVSGTTAGKHEIIATVSGSSLRKSTEVISVVPKLTIVAGTGNLITEAGNGKTLLREPYVVKVNNGLGKPAVGAKVKIKANTVAYATGTYKIFIPGSGAPAGAKSQWVKDASSLGLCMAEQDDDPRNGFLDQSEDDNVNGVRDPGLPITLRAAGVSSGTSSSLDLVVNNNGTVEFEVEYPKSYASWAVVELDVAAQQSSDEAKIQVATAMPGLAVDYNKIDVSLPQQFSPYNTSIPSGTGSCLAISPGSNPNDTYIKLLQ